MYQIRLVRTIKGKDIIDRFKSEYGSIDNLKKLLKKDKKNQKSKIQCSLGKMGSL